MIKKLISTILCMVTLCRMGNFYSCAFDWPWSETENKCEGLKDVKTAYDSCLNDLKEGKGICSQLKVGPKCETDLWLWDYVQIKKALSNLKKCSLNMESTIDNEITIKVADTIKALFKTDSELSQKISKHWLSKSIIIKDYKNNMGEIAKICARSLIGATGALLVGWKNLLAGCVVKGIVDAYAYIQNNDESTKRYSRAFDNILTGIINGDWKCGDIVSLKINYGSGKDYGEHVDFIKQGIYYDKSTKKEYKYMFRTLKEELINIANGNCC